MFLKKFAVVVFAAVVTVSMFTTAFAAGSKGSGGSGGSGGGGGGGGGGGRAVSTGSSTAGSKKGSTSVSFDGMIPADSSASDSGANAGTWYYNPSTDDWKFQFKDGSGAVGWQQLPWTSNGQTQNLWYYFDSNGNMLDGSQVIAGKEYYLNPESNGWKGGMVDAPANNASVTGMITMGSGSDSGAWNGTWYYSPSQNNWKYLYNNGNVAIGWNQLSWTFNGVTRNDWYFFNNDGWMSSGLVNLSGNTYYLNPVSDGFKGAMITGEADVNGKKMTFANSGELLN